MREGVLEKAGRRGALALLLVLAPAVVASLGAQEKPPVTYTDLVPVLRARCVGCHGGDSPKGRLSLESLAELRAGGKRGAPVSPAKPEESLLFLLVSGKKKPVMPPEREGPLKPEEVALIEAWIRGGCLPGEAPAKAETVARPLEPTIYTRPPPVKALAWSKDGERLLVAGYREVLVHRMGSDPAAAELEARLPGHAEEVHILQVSPDGRLLLAAGGSPGRFGEAQLWDLGGRKLERTIRLGKDSLFAGGFTADGARLVLAGTDRALHVLETASGKEVYASEVHSDWVFGAAFSPDGERILSAGRDRTIKVSAAAEGKFLGTLATLDGPVMRVVARPGTPQFLAGGESRKPFLYDAKEMKQVRELEGQPGAILALAASADGSLLAVGGAAEEVRIYQAENGQRKAAAKFPGGWVYAVALRPDGARLAAGGHDGTVRIFDAKDGKELLSFIPVPLGRPF